MFLLATGIIYDGKTDSDGGRESINFQLTDVKLIENKADYLYYSNEPESHFFLKQSIVDKHRKKGSDISKEIIHG